MAAQFSCLSLLPSCGVSLYAIFFYSTILALADINGQDSFPRVRRNAFCMTCMLDARFLTRPMIVVEGMCPRQEVLYRKAAYAATLNAPMEYSDTLQGRHPTNLRDDGETVGFPALAGIGAFAHKHHGELLCHPRGAV